MQAATGKRKKPLYRKLMLILLVTIGPICLMSFFISRSQHEMILKTLIDSLVSKVVFFEGTLSTEVERLHQSTYACVNDDDFVTVAVFSDVISDYKRSESINEMRKKLGLLREMSPYMANISIYMPQLGRSVNAINCDDEISREELIAIQDFSRREGLITWHEERLLVCSAYPWNGIAHLEPSMLMAVEVDQGEIRKVLASMETMEGGGALLLGETWQLGTATLVPAEVETLRQTIAATGVSWGYLPFVLQGEDMLLAWRRCDVMGANLISFLPQRVALSQLKAQEGWTYILLVSAALLLTGAAVLEYHSVHLPVNRMVNAFQEVEGGNREVRLTTGKRDEFQYLYSHFNHMMDTIEDLVSQVYRQKILYQQAQLKQLQTQINPHFFYNSFFAVQGMVDMGEYDAASRMLATLGRYFQFISRSGSELIPLQREVAHAEAYCEVQQVRFSRIRVDFAELPDVLRGVMVPRLILQPLIENAYIHGLEDTAEEGELRVSFEQAGDLLRIHVKNNGQSMSEAELAALEEKLRAPDDAQLEVTGIVNIHRRLRMYYGSPCGLTAARLSPRGTHMVITLKVEGGVTYVSSASGG